LPGSDRVELFLGQAPVLTATVPGVSEGSEINVLRVEGPPRIEGVNGFLATASRRSVPVLDRSGEAPVLVDARFVDADNDRVLGLGDRVVVGFDQPIVVPLGTTPEINFALPVAGDTFGTGARLVAASTSAANRAIFIELGQDPVLRVDGEFSAAAGAPGAPSAVTVAPGTLLTNSVLGAPVPALVGGGGGSG